MSTRLHRSAAALALALLASCDSAPTDPTTAAGSPSDAVQLAAPLTLDWQQTARTVVASNSMSPLAAGRLFAAVGMAALQAVEAVDAETGAGDSNGQGYGAGGRARYEARRGAVAGASATVLGWFSPAAAASFAQMVAAQGGARAHPSFTRGVALGQAAGAEILQHVMSDGFTTPWTGTIPVGPGLWTTTVLPPAGGTLGNVTPYFIDSAEQFRPAPPPAYLSAEFNADLAAVLAIRTNLTTAQNAIALGWAYGGGTYTPVGYWNHLASMYVAAAGMDEAAAARVFGLMGASVFDAMITTFSAKYFYWTLRPHQAEPAITRSFAVPNYPAYPSGHGSVSAASARVLAHFFPDRAAELNALVEEAAMSRIYAGIHFFFDMTAARASAEAVADWVIAQSQ
jgi:membrane-associated phospholipid phosphatase